MCWIVQLTLRKVNNPLVLHESVFQLTQLIKCLSLELMNLH